MDTASEFQQTAWALSCCEAEGYGAQWITDIHTLIKDWNGNDTPYRAHSQRGHDQQQRA